LRRSKNDFPYIKVSIKWMKIWKKRIAGPWCYAISMGPFARLIWEMKS
jgi:hypothetical protein